jgi:transcriptional regulator with XRE-family HTH domain
MIGERLKEERKRLGYSQEAFATTAGITRRPYAEWESGNTSPTAAQLAALSAAGADVLYIVTGERSGAAITPDEREMLALFRAASLTGKAAAVGALKGAADSSKIKVRASGGSNAAGRDLTIGGK